MKPPVSDWLFYGTKIRLRSIRIEEIKVRFETENICVANVKMGFESEASHSCRTGSLDPSVLFIHVAGMLGFTAV